MRSGGKEKIVKIVERIILLEDFNQLVFTVFQMVPGGLSGLLCVTFLQGEEDAAVIVHPLHPQLFLCRYL